MKTLTFNGKPVVPTHDGFRSAGFPTVDAFRAQLKRDPHAPKPFKIGQANFFYVVDLEAFRRRRDAARTAK
jgi:hypothetical protein